MLKFFQLGLGCLNKNRKAVTSCKVIKLSDAADMTTTSWEPVSQWGSIMSCLFWILTTQSDGDLPPDVTANYVRKSKEKYGLSICPSWFFVLSISW